MELKEYLIKNRIPVTEFAESIGYTRNYINLIVNKRVVPSSRLALVIEKATDGEVTTSELLKNNKED